MDAVNMSETHFLLQARPALPSGILDGETDTTTTDSHDWDVSPLTGFMPFNQPISRLALPWSLWEDALDDAKSISLSLGDMSPPSGDAIDLSSRWRARIVAMPLVDIAGITVKEPILRRAHLVLAFILHFYIHSSPQDANNAITIPRSLAVPLLRVSSFLQLPPVLTYSDTVLYNWHLLDPEKSISEINIGITNTLSSTPDETHFYLTSARIELRGVKALDLMRASMNEAFVANATAITRITSY